MAVDRGELRYNIRLTTGQTFRSLRRFRQELREGREEFSSFRAEMRLAGRDAAQAATGIRAAGNALGTVGASRASQALAQQIQDARRARQAFGRIVSELVQIRRELRRVRTESRATGREIKRTGSQAASAGRRGAAGVRRLRKAVKATRGSADRLAGSFLRMGGIISTFIVARGVIDGIRGLIETSIQFNRTIERSELGIAAILTAVGEVRGAFGEVVSQAEQLSLAQNEARRQTQLLRRDALTTAATFQQLTDTFQVALAPGLTAGLDVDKVRRFSLRISQAALALGVAQNQLSEEVRSILSGTIRPQTTRIAVALGITNDDIRRVRDLGQLGQFLEDRFSAFGEAGKRALDTVDGLLGRVADGFAQVTGEAGRSIGFFDDVKDLLRDILDLFLDFDQFGFPTPDPQTLQVLQVFFTSIVDGFNDIREGLSEITFEEAVQGAQALATAITTAVNLAIGLVQGLSDGFSFLGSVIRGITDIIQGVAEALGFEQSEASVRQIARTLVSVLTVLVSIRTVIGIIFGIVTPIVGAVRVLVPFLVRIGGLLRALIPSLATIRALILSIELTFFALPAVIQSSLVALGKLALVAARAAGIVAGVLLAVREAVRFFTGIALNIEETLLTVAASIERIFLNIARGVRRVGANIFNFLAGFFNKFSSAVLQPVISALADLAIETARIGNNLGVLGDKAADAIVQAATGLQVQPLNISLINTDRIEREFRDAFEQNDALFAEIEKRNRERTEQEKAENAKRKSSAKSASDEALAGLNLQQQAAETLVETLDRVTAQFSTTRTVIQSVSAASDRLRTTLEGLELQRSFQGRPDVGGVAGQVQNAVQREQVTLARELLQIRREEVDLDRALQRAAESKANSQKALNSFSENERAIIQQVETALQRRLAIGRQIDELERRRDLARAEERNALERGNTEEANIARQRQAEAAALVRRLQEQREQLEANINAVQEQGRLDENALSFLRERLELLSREETLKGSLAQITAEITRLEEQSLAVQRAQAQAVAQRSVRQSVEQVDALRLQAELLRDIRNLEGPGSEAAQRLAQLRAQSAELRVQNRLRSEALIRQVAELDDTIQRLGLEGQTSSALVRQRNALADQVGVLNTISEIEQERLDREVERARILSEGTQAEAVQQGLEDFANSVETIQQALSGLVTGLLQDFSQGVGNALATSFVNAFDESGRFVTDQFLANLRQAAGQLLQQLATRILSTLIENLIANLISSLIATTTTQTTAAATSAALTTTAATTAADTQITAATTAASIEIGAARLAAAIRAGASGSGAGFSRGGGVGFDEGGHVSPSLPRVAPPPGVAKSDNISAFLTPGEFVQRVSAVRHYGADVMSALNQRLIDPGLLRGLAGLRSLRSLRSTTSRGPGFQEGGPVSENIRQVSANLEAQAGEQLAAESPPAVAFPVGETTLETLLASGPNAFRRFLRDNAGDFDGILRGGRTGG